MGLRDFVEYLTDTGRWGDEGRWESEQEQEAYETTEEESE